MKVLNLQCSHQHSFEGWFASEDDFQSQLARGLIECPLCADKGIHKLPSAPRLNLGNHQNPGSTGKHEQKDLDRRSAAPAPAAPVTDTVMAASGGSSPAAQAAFLAALRQVVANTEDVGERFAEEARRMHYGELEARGIRGQTTAREAVELLEEGIEVMPLPMLPALKETLQ
ncbi:hypothetical protein SAMN05216344_10221 [Polaromonas sp. OV174]|uniref:DUF1178 family protein n=1 Tax=Polaromonas sp. OV174 TaxID=1855300 RepID=UPI0008ED41F2|nr:DUF1178 family protein [Polaromonas sp. OV174]SFB72205.1 hypothetical protein SAMN05216344_10221 [Polaromonas sp. OV174]